MTGGPTTPSGKRVVRWNATLHGINSPKPVVPGLEAQITGFLRIPLCELDAWFGSRGAVYRATQQGGITKRVVIVVITR